MRGIFNYLKLFENKISESSEKEFLDISKFKSSDFNLTSYIKLVISKIDDTNTLVNSLKCIKDSISDEIVHQINSNFNNYMVLISKMQAIDFLVDNIVKPLKNIKHYINEQFMLIDKYEKELNNLKAFEEKNQNEINTVKLTLRLHKNINSLDQLSCYLSTNYESKFLNLNEQNYETKRKILTEIYRYISKIKICQDILVQIKNKELTKEFEVHEIKKLRFLDIIDEIMKILFNNNDLEGKNLENLTYLCLINLIVSNDQERLYQLILDKGGYGLFIENCWKKYKSTNSSTSNRLEEFLNAIQDNFEKNYNFICKVIMNYNLQFNVQENCIVKIILKLLFDEKEIFNCVDPSIFKENFHLLNNFLSNVTKSSSILSFATVTTIKQFFSKFSYFTYYQFLQNDFQKIILEDYTKSKQCIDDDNIGYKIKNTSNLLFNFVKTSQEIFIEKKILFKIMSNFLKYHCQCQKYILKKIDFISSLTNEIKKQETLQENFQELKTLFLKFQSYFQDSFFQNLEKVIIQEKIHIETETIDDLKKTLTKIKGNFVENIKIRQFELDKI